jgi:hypothetical protein
MSLFHWLICADSVGITKCSLKTSVIRRGSLGLHGISVGFQRSNVEFESFRLAVWRRVVLFVDCLTRRSKII